MAEVPQSINVNSRNRVRLFLSFDNLFCHEEVEVAEQAPSQNTILWNWGGSGGAFEGGSKFK